MSDPASIVGTAAGLISLGIQVTQSLVKFYNSYKSQHSTLIGMVERLEWLLDTFQYLEKTLLDRHVQTEEQNLIKTIDISIKKCDELIYELQEECQKFYSTSSNGLVATFRATKRQASYPFRQSTLEKLDEDIAEIRDNLSFALDVLQLKDNSRTQDSIAEVKVLLERVRTHQISSDLRDWLKAPDATVNHNAACAKKHSGTGMWLVKSPKFSRWLTDQSSILWLNGFAGSGKSVLCSTVIQFALRHRGSDARVGIAFFYFTFSDNSKQHESDMLRALLLQLSGQLQDGEADLTRLHRSYNDSIPPPQALIESLRRVIQRFHHVYIALDGLDESPLDGPREGVLETLNSIRTWRIQGLHLFLTSRNEPDIRDSLNLSIEQQVIMQNAGINQDIADSISARLDKDRRLQKWLPHCDKIQEALTNQANGMFRWVECQFRSLQSCPPSEYHLDLLLNSLPKSLDETYERMLSNIDHVEDARRILTLLCFAARPLTVRELIDGIAVEINDPAGFNCKRRLKDFNDLHAICSGLINIDLGTPRATEAYQELKATVQIAHFSVQEYLESERIRHQKAAIFGLISPVAHAEIAHICIVYLLEHNLSCSKRESAMRSINKYPLARFAAEHWNHHYQKRIKPNARLDEFVTRLFQNQDSFATWVNLYDADAGQSETLLEAPDADNIAAPVYYASLLGLDHTLNELITTAQVEDTTTPALLLMSESKISRLVTAPYGRYGNALQAASVGGHEKVVQLLLDKGADVNNQSGNFENALYAASRKGYEKVVELLLKKVADVNAPGGLYDNALLIASIHGHEKVLQLLLNKLADFGSPVQLIGDALYVASSSGYEKVVQLLLDKGAEFNAPSTLYDSALHAASSGGYEKVVQLLLDNGADVNAPSRLYDSALLAASTCGNETVVQLLLDNGADVNAPGEGEHSVDIGQLYTVGDANAKQGCKALV